MLLELELIGSFNGKGWKEMKKDQIFLSPVEKAS